MFFPMKYVRIIYTFLFKYLLSFSLHFYLLSHMTNIKLLYAENTLIEAFENPFESPKINLSKSIKFLWKITNYPF